MKAETSQRLPLISEMACLKPQLVIFILPNLVLQISMRFRHRLCFGKVMLSSNYSCS